MLTALVRKDARLLTPVAIGGAVLFVTPLTVAILAAAASPGRLQDDFVELVDNLPVLFLAGGATASIATPAIFASLGARERRDGSGAMVALLGVPRAKIVLSRVLVGLSAMLTPWVLAAVMAALAVLLWRGPTELLSDLRTIWASLSVGTVTTGDVSAVPLQSVFLAAGLLFSTGGLAWLLGAALRSEILATLLPVFIVLVTMMGVGTVFYQLNARFPGRRTEDDIYTFISVLWLLGALGCIGGTVVAFKRRTP